MHLNPCNKTLFLIQLQLSRFFYMLNDFENQTIPNFRHPLLISKLY